MATGIRNQKLFCDNCGQEYILKLPIEISLMNKKIKAFTTLHRDCEKIWTEPVVDQSKDIEEKAMWWIANGHIGNSSKTMWLCFMNQKDNQINHPYDPDDFSRCYKLLEAVPEWKEKSNLSKLRKLSPAWNNLVDNWDKLTEMFEQNRKDQWKNAHKIGMYEFMQTLIN
jgi:hypothetical protein